MTKEVEIETLRSFNRTPQGDLCEVGDRFPVAASRAEELERLGLARRTQVAPDPTVQALPDPETPEAPGRRRGGSRATKD
ncbi:hypothetical protein [Aureimonas phyllosphaerae]|uniref:Uncharacterized protein n=1 Tax=Aureimonas phyllosphaerae TaxID=1166078 RepID=A0A7W6BT96_9HYPH|nr:hypothetical protein [Aureimonas phyllosphaerae]MBB3934285.1 hypothetical protein [Aureimonas phyllosphaerae]MBB3958499.1 hypothetical protein [Aureimonas phyllosphaerae]SFE98009.1 hypothetical protein SAMN05216566_101475 [Aureimonas phyllosphaerae]